ncbi:MAG: hypothetical protein H9535_18750 [Ignavibacteria bacterium]|nr:hypothetical protein [Ignavibacteria bacterium]MBL7990170.1 hypothetical protein [Candidatus Kapabacteria bacterium]
MARFILLTVVVFVAITFVSLALKGILRRFIGGVVSPVAGKKGREQDKRILYKKDDVVVLQGEAKENTTPT